MNNKKDKLIKRKKRMEKMVKQFQEYVATYSNQPHYLIYTDETFLNDMLYGIGLTFSDKFKYLDGFYQWKKVLEDFFKTDKLCLKLKRK